MKHQLFRFKRQITSDKQAREIKNSRFLTNERVSIAPLLTYLPRASNEKLWKVVQNILLKTC